MIIDHFVIAQKDLLVIYRTRKNCWKYTFFFEDYSSYAPLEEFTSFEEAFFEARKLLLIL